jgi:hypothetical protein
LLMDPFLQCEGDHEAIECGPSLLIAKCQTDDMGLVWFLKTHQCLIQQISTVNRAVWESIVTIKQICWHIKKVTSIFSQPRAWSTGWLSTHETSLQYWLYSREKEWACRNSKDFWVKGSRGDDNIFLTLCIADHEFLLESVVQKDQFQGPISDVIMLFQEHKPHHCVRTTLWDSCLAGHSHKSTSLTLFPPSSALLQLLLRELHMCFEEVTYHCWSGLLQHRPEGSLELSSDSPEGHKRGQEDWEHNQSESGASLADSASPTTFLAGLKHTNFADEDCNSKAGCFDEHVEVRSIE